MTRTLAWGATVALLALSGCSTIVGLSAEEVKTQIEVGIGGLGGADWVVAGTLTRDGQTVGTATIKWTCRRGDDGKLAGCTEPIITFSPQ